MRKKKIFFGVLFGVCIFCVMAVPAYATESGSHWWDTFSWFGDVANFIKSLVVPPANYWHNRLALLNGVVNEKFAGLGQLYQTLNDFFFKLGNPASAELRFAIPDNFLFSGYRGFSMNFFGAAAPYIRFLRSFLSAGCFIFTVVICYNKLRIFFTERE